MFIRVKSTPKSPRKSVQIVESVRDGNKVKQRIVRYVGIAMDDQELVKLKDLAELIKAKIQEEKHPSLFTPEKLAKLALEGKKKEDKDLFVNLRELKEEQRSIIGIHEIYGKLYSELFSSVLGSNLKKTEEILFHIVMARIANPASKRASVWNLEHDFGISLNLDQVYRMMDKLDENVCTTIQENAFMATSQILGGKIDVIFVDATTLYFESFTEDELKKNGYSKDLKFNQPQVLLALMVTKQGLPIGYEAFPGSTYEGHTLLPLLGKIKKKHEIDKVILVADSAMFNEKNLQLLEKEGYEYIVGARLKNLSKSLKKEIKDLSNYSLSFSDDPDDKTSFREIEYNKRRIVVSHNTKRARKDAHDRKEAVDKLIKKLKKNENPEQLISNYGYKKFLKVEGNSKVLLNKEKLLEQEKWDGLHGMISNSKNLSAQEILSQYRGLWQVEESFRITKHDLKVRPIFHWTPKRIRAHIAICFLAFTCIRHLEYRTALQYTKLSPEVIRKALMRIQVSVLKHPNGNRYAIPSEGTQDSKKLYQVMGCRYSTTPYQVS
jgi:transposase